MEYECNYKCRSLQHGNKITSALTKGNELEVLSYIRYLCCNVFRITDGMGRSALHVAASCGKLKTVEWLLNHDVDINAQDWESGWTALHRSLFYGQLAAARLLIMHGANCAVQDHDGYSPLDLVQKDRLPYIEYSVNGCCDAYVWGTNTNFNLGDEKQQSRASPELVEIFKKERLSIKQVVMSKYHTLFLSLDGKVFSCGHGHGGRLGHGSEQTVLTPTQIKTLSSEFCTEIAAGVDHSVFLTSSGGVWTCGLNSHHQLGHQPPPNRHLSPRLIKQFHQKGIVITGICASRFHTIAYAKNAVFSFGLNAGQLGHLKGDKTEISPRQISALNYKDAGIVSVAVSDGATVCLTSKGDICVLHEFQCRKIASKQLDVASFAAVGGRLESRCCPTILKENGGIELKILILTKHGTLHLWSETNPHLVRCLFSMNRQLNISSFVFNISSVGLISDKGEGFVGYLKEKKQSNTKIDAATDNNKLARKEKKGKESYMIDNFGKENVPLQSQRTSYGFVEFLNKDECPLIKLQRVPHIHRGVFITSDPEGQNFSALQGHPSIGVIETSEILHSEFNDHFAAFLEETDTQDALHDIIFQVDNQEFPAHKFILISQSDYFRRLVLEEDESKKNKIVLDKIHPIIFRQILQFVYSQTCDFLKVDFKLPSIQMNNKSEINKSGGINGNNYPDSRTLSACDAKLNRSKNPKDKFKNNKNQQINPINLVEDAAKKFGLTVLAKQMEMVKHSNDKVTSVVILSEPRRKFSRKKFPEFYDLAIEAEDGTKIFCHKCILVARSEYFASMFCNNWIETAANGSLYLPVTSDVLEVVIDYLYTDEVNKLEKINDIDFLCRILVMADQLLLKHLKTICEKSLEILISLKNAMELLQFSFTYQAEQLQNVCKEFISVNLAAILEIKNFAAVSDEAMIALTKTYREMIPAMQYRYITPYLDNPTVEEIMLAASKHSSFDEILVDDVDHRTDILSSTKKQKARRKNRVRRESENEASPRDRCGIDSPQSMDLQSAAQEHLVCQFSEDLDSPSVLEVGDAFNNCVPLPLLDKTPEESPRDVENEGFPWVGPKEDNKSLDLKAIMSQQENELRQETNNKRAVSGSKKIQKISQKQRKKLLSAGSFTDSEFGSPITSPEVGGFFRSPPTNPWGNPSELATSLKDIMDDQKSTANQKHNFQTNNSEKTAQLKMERSSPVCHLPLSSSGSNPWLKAATSNIPTFADILLDEENQKPVVPLPTKALHLIQIEEQAIEGLRKLYKADSNPDERITVMRVLPQSVSAPMWKARQKDRSSH